MFFRCQHFRITAVDISAREYPVSRCSMPRFKVLKIVSGDSVRNLRSSKRLSLLLSLRKFAKTIIRKCRDSQNRTYRSSYFTGNSNHEDRHCLPEITKYCLF